MGNKIDDVIIARIRELYIEEGKKIKEIAEELSICEDSVIKYLRGIKKRTYGGREPGNKVKIDESDLKRIYEETNSSRETGERFGVSKATILRELREKGVTVKKVGGYKRPKSSHQRAKGHREAVVVNGKERVLHRYLMEKKLGRELKPEETVHHIDMDKSNNTRENLYLFENESEHGKAHFRVGQLISELFKRGTVGFKQGKYYIIKDEENKERQR